MLGGVGGTNDDVHEATDDSKEIAISEVKHDPIEDEKVKEKLDQFERLKAEFEQIANDLIAERRARSSF